MAQRPVYELLGGPQRDGIHVYANGWYTGHSAPQEIAGWARGVVEKGFDAMKFDPFGTRNYVTIFPAEAQLTEDRVAAVRDAVGPHVVPDQPRRTSSSVPLPNGPGLGRGTEGTVGHLPRVAGFHRSIAGRLCVLTDSTPSSFAASQ